MTRQDNVEIPFSQAHLEWFSFGENAIKLSGPKNQPISLCNIPEITMSIPDGSLELNSMSQHITVIYN